MTAAIPSPVGFPAGEASRTVRRARGFMIGLHVALVAVGPAFTITGFEGRPGDPVLVVAAAAAVGALQLRHSLAAARGERPAGWPLTLLALVALVYLPVLWFTWDWAAMQYSVMASAAMLLRGRAAVVAAAAPVAATSAAGVQEALVDGVGGAQSGFFLVYWMVGLVTGGAALYGSARLVRVVGELTAARTELAELAIGRERLRVSRDLHDLLGQSLSAVSLKGDLAGRLLHTDPAAARAEIDSLTALARDALRDIRAITRDRHAVSLATETDGAAALLAAAGITARIQVHLPNLQPPLEEVLAWAVREGVTNVLRHSQASTCSITAARQGGSVRLEIVNDGARPVDDHARAPADAGTGLAGLARRAQALSGSVATERTADGTFLLRLELPGEVA